MGKVIALFIHFIVAILALCLPRVLQLYWFLEFSQRYFGLYVTFYVAVSVGQMGAGTSYSAIFLFFALEVQLPWSLLKLRRKGHNVFMQYILYSLNNNCDK